MLKVYLPMHVVQPSTCKNGLFYISPSYLPPQTISMDNCDI